MKLQKNVHETFERRNGGSGGEKTQKSISWFDIINYRLCVFANKYVYRIDEYLS